jgi:hypothetical protein
VRGLSTDDGAAWAAAKLERSWRKIDADLRTEFQTAYDAASRILASRAADHEQAHARLEVGLSGEAAPTAQLRRLSAFITSVDDELADDHG